MNVITGNIVMFMMFPVLVLEGGMEMESHEEKIGSAGGRRTGHEDRAWLFFNIGWSVIYLLWRGFRTLPLGQGPVSAAAGIALLTVEILGMLEALVYYFNMYHMESHEVPEVLPEEYPDVDVFIATYNEPPELLYKTINGCLHMEYPDKEKVHIYLCDDGKRPEMRALAEQMGIHYLDREERKGAKAGNLNHAMSVTGSPLIATFDADMVPKSNFLLVTAAYFVDREKKNRELEEKDRILYGQHYGGLCHRHTDTEKGVCLLCHQYGAGFRAFPDGFKEFGEPENPLGQGMHPDREEDASGLLQASEFPAKGQLLGFCLVLVCSLEAAGLYYVAYPVCRFPCNGSKMHIDGDAGFLAAYVYQQ